MAQTPSPEVLNSPTLGAYRRQRVITGMCEVARVALAVEVLQEARRLWLVDQLGSVFLGLTRGADPDVVARRLRRFADQVDDRPQVQAWAA